MPLVISRHDLYQVLIIQKSGLASSYEQAALFHCSLLFAYLKKSTRFPTQP
jgi:hypothetical protein